MRDAFVGLQHSPPLLPLSSAILCAFHTLPISILLEVLSSWLVRAAMVCMPSAPRSPRGEVVGAALEVLAVLRGLEHSGPPELKRGKVERVEESVPLRLHLPLAIGLPPGEEHVNSVR